MGESGGSSSPGGCSACRIVQLLECHGAPCAPGAVGQAWRERPRSVAGAPVFGAGVAGPMVKVVGRFWWSARAGRGRIRFQLAGCCGPSGPGVSGMWANAGRSGGE